MSQTGYALLHVKKVELSASRKKQMYSRCTVEEETELRTLIGVFSWMAKETRPDLAGGVALLQQAFPEPQVRHLVEANQVAEEALQHQDLKLTINSIPRESLGIGVFTDAGWGNILVDPSESEPTGVWIEKKDMWIYKYHGFQRRPVHRWQTRMDRIRKGLVEKESRMGRPQRARSSPSRRTGSAVKRELIYQKSGLGSLRSRRERRSWQRVR